MKTIVIKKEKQYPLYSAELAGEAWDKGKNIKYEMIIITKWTDRTAKAKEVSHKAYYFTPDYEYLREQVENEEWCKDIYENNKQYEIFEIIRES